MTRTVEGHRTASTPAEAEQEAALRRILVSRSFRRSARHRRFLEYLVRSAADGDVANTREMVVGVTVFDRSIDTFDPRKDPIVRVEAGRLREKLSRYYQEEGRSEPLVIEIPVGGYQIRFVPRSASPTVRGFDDADRTRAAIAVIPLEHLGVRQDDEMLCLGLADQLIDMLSRMPGRRVVARHSVNKARVDGMSLAKIARLFGVAYVLSGSVQRDGKKLRCIVNLCRAKDERYLWSQQFECLDTESTSLFAFQDTIAAEATAAVDRVDGADAATQGHVGTSAPRTSNGEARDLYEKARYLAHKRTFESCERAIEFLERAIVLDPRFARAHAQLGMVNFSLAGLRSEAPARNLVAARHAAKSALQLDPEDGEALSLLAAITFRIDRDWSAAEPMFIDALRLNRHASSIHIAFANCLAYNGRFDEALEHADIARRGDPLNLGLRAVAASVACFASRYDQAIREHREVLSLEPDHLFSLVNLAIASMAIGDFDAAEQALDRFTAVAPEQPGPQFYRIACTGFRGRRDEAVERLDAAMHRLGERTYSRFALATAQSATNQVDAMYRSLDFAERAHDLLYVTLPVYPLFRDHHGSARFAQQLARTGLRPVDTGTRLAAEAS